MQFNSLSTKWWYLRESDSCCGSQCVAMIHMTPININVLTIEFTFDSMIRVYLCLAFYFRTNLLMNLVRFYINRPEAKFTFLQVPMCPCACFHLFFYHANHSRMKTTAKFSASFHSNSWKLNANRQLVELVDFRRRKEVIGVYIFRSPSPTILNEKCLLVETIVDSQFA